MPTTDLRAARTAVVEALLPGGLVFVELAAAAPAIDPEHILQTLQAMRDDGAVHDFHAGHGPTLWVLRPAHLTRPTVCTYCEDLTGQPEYGGLCEDCAAECPDGCRQPVAGCTCCDDYEQIDPI